MKALKSKLAKAILADARNRENLSNFLDQNNTISDYSQNKSLELIVNNKTVRFFVKSIGEK